MCPRRWIQIRFHYVPPGDAVALSYPAGRRLEEGEPTATDHLAGVQGGDTTRQKIARRGHKHDAVKNDGRPSTCCPGRTLYMNESSLAYELETVPPGARGQGRAVP